jgi:hypothetical protein
MPKLNKAELLQMAEKMSENDTVSISSSPRAELVQALMEGELDKIKIEGGYNLVRGFCALQARKRYGKEFGRTHGIKFLYAPSEGFVTVSLRPKN